MGLPIENTLDFWDALASPPDPPLNSLGSSGASVYLDALGRLCISQNGASPATSTGEIEMAGRRGNAIWFTNETGTPRSPVNPGSPLNSAFASGQLVTGDYVVRESDGEVFQTSGVNLTIADQGFALGGGANSVTATLARAHLGPANQTLAATGWTKVTLNTIDYDGGGGAWSTSSYHYTAPVAGYYRVSACLTFPVAQAAGVNTGGYIAVNDSTADVRGIEFSSWVSPVTNTYPPIATGSDVIKLAAGETLSMFAYTSAAGIVVAAGEGQTFMSVSLVAPITNAPVQMSTGARAYMSGSSATSSTGGWNKVPLANIDSGDDPGGHFDLANQQYKVSQAGLYYVAASIALSMSVSVAAQAFVSRNGAPGGTTDGFYLRSDTSPSVETWIGNGSGLMRCAVGDTIALYWNNTPGDVSVLGGADYDTHLDVVMVDQPIGNSVQITQATFFYSGGGNPTGISGAQNGAYCIRESDGEVFQYASGVWVDQGFSVAGQNAVTTTIARLTVATGFNLGTSLATLALNSITYDPGSHASATAYSYTVSTPGYYRVSGAITSYGPAGWIALALVKNGSQVMLNESEQNAVGTLSVGVDDLVQCAAGDVITLSGSASAAGSFSVGAGYGSLSVQLVAPLTNAPVAPNTGARAYRNSTLALASNTWTKIPLDTVAAGNDPGGHMDVTANHRYNVASGGWYQVNANVQVSDASADFIGAAIYKNGANVAQGLVTNTASSVAIVGADVSDLVYCAAGDYLELWGFTSAAESLDMVGVSGNYLSVVKVDQTVPSSIGTNTAVRAHRNAAVAAASGWNKVLFDTLDFDKSGGTEMDVSSTYRFTAKSGGTYDVRATIAATSTANAQYTAVGIYKNGTLYSTGSTTTSVGASQVMRASVGDLLALNTGDYIEIYIYTSASMALVVGVSSTYMSAAKVDN